MKRNVKNGTAMNVQTFINSIVETKDLFLTGPGGTVPTLVLDAQSTGGLISKVLPVYVISDN